VHATKLSGFHALKYRASHCTGLKMQYRVVLLSRCTKPKPFTRRFYKDVGYLHFFSTSYKIAYNMRSCQLMRT
ncbi:MAG: hypothetical protein ACKPFA_00180, partial [Dolichospermum sp.]